MDVTCPRFSCGALSLMNASKMSLCDPRLAKVFVSVVSWANKEGAALTTARIKANSKQNCLFIAISRISFDRISSSPPTAQPGNGASCPPSPAKYHPHPGRVSDLRRSSGMRCGRLANPRIESRVVLAPHNFVPAGHFGPGLRADFRLELNLVSRPCG